MKTKLMLALSLLLVTLPLLAKDFKPWVGNGPKYEYGYVDKNGKVTQTGVTTDRKQAKKRAKVAAKTANKEAKSNRK